MTGIRAKLIYKNGADETTLTTVPDKSHGFVTKDGTRWSVEDIYWVQESVAPSFWCLCIKLKK